MSLRKPYAYVENKNCELYIDGVSAKELENEFGTPLYVISENRIKQNYRKIHNALIRNYKKIRIHYAAKANSNISVLKILKKEDAYLDAVSPGEVFLALQAGFSSERILFTGTSVKNDELDFLTRSKVTINVDSLSQLNRVLKMTIPPILSVRINPDVRAGHHVHNVTAGSDSKFGLWTENAIEAYKMAKNAGIKRFGIHMHIGSGILTVEPFLLATDKLMEIAKRVHDQLNIDFEFIDIGGGLGVPYKPKDQELNLNHFSDKILDLYKRKIEEFKLGEPIFSVEPGRYIVCDSGFLLTSVNTVKITPFKKFVGVDAGFNTLIRPIMYGSYHHILVANKMGLPKEETYDVAGPICESGDLLARERKLPRIQEGDLLAILNAGAYGHSMSSQYNSRPKAAEVLVKDGEYSIIRKKECFDSLLLGQMFARWLE